MERKDIGKASLIFLFLSVFSFSKEIIVCKECEINTITEALKVADSGDTIIVKNGIYREGTIIVNKSVKLIGENYPILDGENKHEVVRITAKNVIFTGFKVINSGVSELEDIAGIKVINTSGCVIKNNILRNNFWGIYLAKVKDCTVEGNDIKGREGTSEVYTGNGIHLWYCRNIRIVNNKIRYHRDGIYFEFVKKSLIEGNLSEYNWRYGLHFMFSHEDIYINNIFRYNGAGVAVMYTKKVLMQGNRFEKNWGDSSYGLLLKAISDSKIVNNVFYKNTTGILIDETQRTIIKHNDFIENGWALRIWANSMDNTITENNFLGNTFEVSTNSKLNPNKIFKNYWSSYRGYDLNGDGIGDIPHRPVKLFSYIVENNPAASILLKSFFVELLNRIEEVFPVIIPTSLEDSKPLMRKITWKR
ncbi:MAG TPA: nitrous oxide reductase family maturation protein NosD [Aquificaceae bacterium]|nr:nitrous oxide reductase family maturation protein NosD [Aquificaceae bacterium]HIQ48436.1 nitrous oxide reductase family maturation protein NosD [Aquifex aeolicus]